MPNPLLQKLLTMGEENAGALIRRLRGAAPEVEDQANAVARRLEAAAPEVAEDSKYVKGLRNVENEYVEPAQKMIPDNTAASIADNVVSSAEQPSTLDAIKNLSANQKAVAGAGILTAASAPLFMKGDDGGNQPPPPKDTTNMVGASDNNEDDQTESDDDENDTIQHPINKQPDQKSASDYLALSKQQMPVAQTVSTTQAAPVKQPDQFSQQLEDARSRDASNGLLFGLLKAAQQGGSALANTKADTTYADTQLAKPNELTNELKVNQDLLNERKNILDKDKLRDSTSTISQLARQVASQVGLPVSDTTTAKELEDAGLPIGTLFGQKQNMEARKEIAQLKAQEIAATRATKAEADKEKQQVKDQNAYTTWLTGQTKGRSGIVQNALTQVQRGESLNEMFNALPKKADGTIDFGLATKAHKEELIKAIDTMLSGGRATVSGSHELRQAYQTGYDQLAKIRQAVSGDSLPSLGQQQIFHQMYDLMQRESNVARLQAARALDAGGSKAFKSLSPDDKREQIRQLTGVTPEEQSLMNDQHADLPLLVQLRQKGLDPAEVLAAVKGGKSPKEILGNQPATPLTTNNRAVNASQTVTIRRKSDGLTKMLAPEAAAKYLNDPNFERVQ